MLTFSLAVFLLLITPGPGVLSLAGVGAAFGSRAGVRYFLGLFLGTNLVALAVVSGLAAVLFAVPIVRQILLVLSALYLVYLASRIALAGSNIAFIRANKKPGILAGLLLQTINPNAYAVNTTLFTGFAFMPDVWLIETLIKFAIINTIWVPIHVLWLFAGSSLQRLDLPPKTQFLINIAMAVAMLSVVALAGLSLI